MAVVILELEKPLQHLVPLLVVVSLHLVFDLPLKADYFQAAQAFFGQPRIRRPRFPRSRVDLLFLWFASTKDSLKLCLFVALRLDPLAQLEVRFVTRRHETIAVSFLVLDQLQNDKKEERELLDDTSSTLWKTTD